MVSFFNVVDDFLNSFEPIACGITKYVGLYANLVLQNNFERINVERLVVNYQDTLFLRNLLHVPLVIMFYRLDGLYRDQRFVECRKFNDSCQFLCFLQGVILRQKESRKILIAYFRKLVWTISIVTEEKLPLARNFNLVSVIKNVLHLFQFW